MQYCSGSWRCWRDYLQLFWFRSSVWSSMHALKTLRSWGYLTNKDRARWLHEGNNVCNGKLRYKTGTCWFLLRGCVNTELFEHRFSVLLDEDCTLLSESGVECFHSSWRIDPSPSAQATLKGMTADLRQSTRMQEGRLLYLAEHVHLIEILS